MTFLPALISFLGKTSTTTKSSLGSELVLPVLLVLAVAFYYFFYKPQQRKMKEAREKQGSDIGVGDEVQTIGGIIGTVLEVHGDRYTLLTGALNDDGNLDGPQPTRIVFVRQAIARKIDPLGPANPADADPTVSAASDLGEVHGSNGTNHSADDGHDHDHDHDHDGADTSEETEEA
ncbi:MAG TPA: preprotein translocase subunit YajC [Acidimicrobiales bacterium]|jgi:preprotein translocase YajC subunit